MNILQELTELLETLGLAVETGIFSDAAPNEYAVIVPLSDVFGGFADDKPQYESQAAQISLYSRGNYQRRKNEIVKALIIQDFYITDRRFIEHENETGYYHYAIDTNKSYKMEESIWQLSD